MKLTNILTVYWKELRDVLRDRRTLMSMIVIPALMPVVGSIAMGTAYKAVKSARSQKAKVMMIGAEHAPATAAKLRADDKLRVLPLAEDWREKVSNKDVGAVVEFSSGFEQAMAGGDEAGVKIYNYQGELKSNFAVSEIKDVLTDLRDSTVAARLEAKGLPAKAIKPFDIDTENVAPPEKVGGNAIGGLIPYFFIIFCYAGAMYPAIDLTAGEKERGTMETILCSPLGRIELVLGKFLLVVTASLATVVCSLTSMTLVALAGGKLLAKGLAAEGAKAATHGVLPAIDPAGLMLVVMMVIPIAVLFAGVLLAIALKAKSYREAQSYVAPLIMVVILPAMMAMMPGVEMNAKLALVPVLNVALLSKELVSGVFHWPVIATVFGSLCVYAGLSLAWCVRMFNREDVIFRT